VTDDGRIGSYVVMRELGRGGMGIVYEAKHEMLEHRVALKVLHPELSARTDIVQRFFNEARAADSIDHPGIARVLEVGITDDQQAYLAMELLHGESLAHRMYQRGTLAVRLAVAYARQIADVLAAAHAAGIVHRDLKPDNVFLVPDAASPCGARVCLLDFGIAKLISSDAEGEVFTASGAMMGTPYYMSPEQSDDARRIDHRTDLYSLGCILFQMLTGQLPFVGTMISVIGQHRHTPPPAVREMRPDCPDEVAAIVARLLAKSRDARFADAASLADALAAWQATAPEPTPGARAPTAPVVSRDHVTASSDPPACDTDRDQL